MDRSFLVDGAIRAFVPLTLLAVPSCASRLPSPEFGPHTSMDVPVEVPSPPPESVRIDDIYPSSDPRAVWVDGSWTWQGQRWSWKAGSWQIAPDKSYYSRSALVRIPVAVYDNSQGGAQQNLKGYAIRLMFIPGHWHQRSGGVVQAQGVSSRSE